MRTRMKERFGSWSFYKEALAIGIPVMLQALIQSLVSLIDSFMVAGLGDVKMSGVNISGQICFIFMVMQNMICASGGIFLTQYFGAKQREGMRQSVAFKVVASLSTCIFYFLATFVFTRPVLSLMVIGNSQAELILEEGQKYMYLMGFIGIQMMISSILSSSYREIGRVRVILVITLIAAGSNAFLNWVLIYGHLGMPRLEVEGAAYATIIAKTVEMLLLIGYTIKERPEFISFSVFKRIDWALFGRILKKGSLLIISQMMWVLSESFTAAIYNGRGNAAVVSGMAASFSIANLFFISFDGITTATGVLIGKSLGRNELDDARKEKTWMLSAAIIFGCIMCLVGVVTVLLVPVVFGNLSIDAQNICRAMLLLMALFMPLWTFVNTQLAVCRAGGDTKVGFFVDGGTTAVMIPMLLILAFFTNASPVMMYFGVKALDVGKIIVATHEMKKERWVVNLSNA
ncbi:mATE efflux family protein [Firmicutes bacterium CAG:95]|mgnify:FL=1|nr:mATE efflux family protein [Firmicutes bacterium CAG:95]